jgi:modulator of FtsH protease HflK
MAWNQPGGNGGKDPWGGRGGQEGPPDLDEVLKKLQSKVNRVFGGGKSSGGLGSGASLRGGGAKGLVLLLVLALIGWVFAGIYIVDPPEQGVVLRFGKYVRTTEPGPHWVPYFVETVETVNVEQVRSQDVGFRRTGTGQSAVPHESLMLTEDENIIDIQFAVQYRVRDPAAYLFNVLDPDNTLRQATESAVREIIGKSSMDFVITEGRDVIASRAQDLIQEILDRYRIGMQIVSVNMQDAQPPKEVQDAFFDAVKAREDEVRLKNEARAYAADILPKARGEADAIRERARGYQQRVVAAADGETDRFLKVLSEYAKAPDVTRKRLYLEAVETVMANSTKVLIDVEGGNNIMYLPLDRLIPRADGDDGAIPDLSSPPETVSPRARSGDSSRQRMGLRGRARQ